MVETNEIIPRDLQHRAEDAAHAEDEAATNGVEPGGPESIATKKAEIQEKRRAAYSTATTRLREENRDKFDALMLEECHKRGVEWEPRPNDESRALSAVQELLAKYPHLKPRVAAFVSE